MTEEEIADLLNISTTDVSVILNPGSYIANIKTAEKARVFYRNCPPDMNSAVMERWEELVTQEILRLTTVEEAKMLYYNNCPPNMQPAVMRKWEELVTQEILRLTTVEEAQALYNNCPLSMRLLLIKKMKDDL